MIKKGITILAISVFSLTVAAQTKVTVGIARGKDYGVTYILPKTEIEITIKATKHTYTPGEYAKYAEQYLRLEKVPLETSIYWTFDNLQTKTIGIPDKNNVYFVKMKDKTVAPLMELTEDGIVRSINMPFSTGKKSENVQQRSENQEQEINPRKFMTEEILMSNSTAKMAELVAKEIYNIRESKNALLRGEADNMPKDGVQLKLMLDNLNLQERVMTEMFAGKIKNEEKIFTFHISPKEMKDEVVLRFSRKLGILDKGNLAGEPIYITLTNLKSISIPPTDEKKEEIEGIAYNVPGRGHITLSYHSKVLYDTEIPITQFGTVEYLAPVLFNKKSTTKVLFSINTGGLMKVDREE